MANVNQLNSIRNHLSAHFIQIADLDLDIAPYNQGTGWQAIGSGSNPFTGSFDGAGFSIGSLYINNPTADYQALFGYTRNASIQGITLDDVMVNGKDYCAALVASAENSQITECHVSGSINGAANSGGLVGSLEMMSSLSNSSAEINLSGTNAIGGLCGYLKGSSLVSGSVARGAVSGGTAAGGLVGILADSEISDCYSRAAVSGTRYIGGLLGINDLDGQVNRCYSTGLVSGNQNTGGLIGRSILAHTTDSYWDTQTSGQASSAGGEARNTEQMLPPYEGNTYAAWDFASIWNAHPTYNDGYPYLEWEYVVPTAVALLVYNKNNLNAYDTGFINVLNTITTDYEMIDIAEISSGQKNLSTYRVVISNFMGFGTTAATAFNSIAAQLETATQAGTEFIVGSESVAIPVVLGLANGTMNGNWGPALNDTRAISNIAHIDAISQGVNPIPNYQSYLGQNGNMLANYFGAGVFWKVMTSFYGNFYTQSSYNSFPIFRLTPYGVALT
ncbi:MAG: hypothetical protein LRZ88_10640 [Candidatus Cloacimonetes bacterium]|nr:hypothetical protein [Candidatus Cloacimonadota bacterium]